MTRPSDSAGSFCIVNVRRLDEGSENGDGEAATRLLWVAADKGPSAMT